MTEKPVMAARWRVGDHVYDRDRRVVVRADGTEQRINPKAAACLDALLVVAGRTVTRDSLLAQVWGERYPSDQVISRAMADLRLAFGARASDGKPFETIPKQGYRLTVPAQPLAEAEPPGSTEATATEPPNIAVRALLAVVAVLGISIVARQLLIDVAAPTDERAAPARDLVLRGTPLTSDAGIEHQPRVAESGEWIVYAAKSSVSDWDIYRAPSNGGPATPVAATKGIEHGPAIAPDGRSIAHVLIDEGGCEVVVQPIAGGEPRRLARCTDRFATTVDFAPDGRRIAFTAELESGRPIAVVDLETGEARPASAGAGADGTDFYPRFSPGGGRIAFMRGMPNPDHRSRVVILDLASGSERAVTKAFVSLGGLDWVDRERIVYAARVGETLQLRVVDVKTGRDTRWPVDDVLHPDVHAPSGVLVAAARRSDTDVAVFADGRLRVVAASTAADHAAGLSPDGDWIAFVSDRAGHPDLWLARVRSPDLRRLTDLRGARIDRPSWDAAGARLAFSIDYGQGPRLRIQELLSGSLADPSPDQPIADPVWRGETVVASCHDGAQWRLCEVTPESGDRRWLTDAPAYFPQLADDGRVYFTGDQDGLHAYDFVTDEVELSWTGLPRASRGAWAVDGMSIIYLAESAGDAGTALVRHDRMSGATTVLAEERIPLFDARLSLSRDGERIAVTTWRAAQDDIHRFELPR